ncbi:hypothetical protein Pan181_48280 [Aeoliella mucimassa]|uniref:Uncharacterized protein n=1 Tax=Aeoliella mucimassa TaxID=2527972 RepID=A0A518AV38_9BACT|nr:hypothetical protein Pan181_48280 [Aeoliella mucimassa]
MTTNLIIALVLAVGIVVLWGWLGDWSGSRSRSAEQQYWLSQQLHCPNCGTQYHLQSPLTQISCFGERVPQSGVSLVCVRCDEVAIFACYEFSEPPMFTGFDRRTRQCSNCGEQCNSTPDEACPICGSVADKTIA